jgi:hypothetical protein
MAQPGSITAQPQTVPITVNKDGSCSPEHAQAHGNDFIIWNGEVNELHFPDDNPFEDGKGKKFKPNKKYKVSKLRGKFKYNVITPTGTYDPDIEIIPPP